MPALVDVKFETLRALGYSGAMNDMLLPFWNAGLSGGGPGPGVPDLEATLVAGTNGTFIGYNTSFSGVARGSMTPSTIEIGVKFERFYWFPTSPTRYEIAISPNFLGESYWARIEVTGITDPGWNGGGHTFLSNEGLVYTANLVNASFWTDSDTTVAAFVNTHEYDIKVYLQKPFFTATLVAGTGLSSRTGFYDGANNGGLGGPFGSLDNTAADLYPPTTVVGVFQLPSGFNQFDVGFTGTGYDLSAGQISAVVIRGVTDPNYIQRFDAVSATKVTGSGETFWRFTSTVPFVDGDSYMVELYRVDSYIRADMVTGTTTRGFNAGVPDGSMVPRDFPGETYSCSAIIDTTTGSVDFYIDEVNVPNTDDTFTGLVITRADGAVIFDQPRSAGSYNGNVGGQTRWRTSGLVTSIVAGGQDYLVEVKR